MSNQSKNPIKKSRWSQEYANSPLRMADQVLVGCCLVLGASGIALAIVGLKPYLLVIVGIATAIASIFGIYSLAKRRFDPVQVNLEPIHQPENRHPQNTSFSTKNMKNKYLGELIIGVFLLVLICAFFGGGSYFIFAQGGLAQDPFNSKLIPLWLVPLFGVVVFVFWVKSLVGTLQEIELYQQTFGKEAVIRDGQVSFSIGLLEGKPRAQLRKSRKPYFNVMLDRVHEFRIIPLSSRAGGGGGNSSRSPAYYVISLKNPADTLYVLRNPFKGQEEAFIMEMRNRLSVPILQEDELQ